jgi:hypothetical protein
MQDLVECEIDTLAAWDRVAQGRSVTVNIAESTLSWLKARGLVSDRQFEAGERSRVAWPRVTMQWEARVDSSSGGESFDPHLGQVQAKRRFDGALSAIGSGLNDVAWRVICAGESVPVAERALAGRRGRGGLS